MWRLTWAQMRRNVGKLIAVGIAIALGTGFITATFVTTNAIEDTALAAATASIGSPDVVVQDSSYSLTDDDVDALAQVDGVGAVYAAADVFREITTAQGTEVLMLNPPAPDDRLASVDLTDGVLPTAAGEIAVPGATAERLGVTLGDTVTIVSQIWDDADSQTTRTQEEAVVVGLLSDGSGFGFGMPSALASEADIAAWSEASGDTSYGQLTLVASDGTTPEALLDAVATALPGASVITGEAFAQDVAASFTGGIQIFRALILAFAAVAMAVAGIVIANTFTVLVAQRTRTLALLRCVGATQRQVKRSVRLEALVLGVVASIAGIGLGLGIGQIALSIIARQVEGVPAPTTVPVDLATILVPLVVGILVTVVAASGAARLATSVSPLAAMRPVDAIVSARSSRARKVIGWILMVGGFAAMAGALAIAQAQPEGTFEVALAIGVLGGVVSIVGVVMAAITIVPAVSRVLGRGIARVGGVPQRLAATNSVRNPRRTTSTATALLVGVALVTMMSTGAAMARTQLTNELDTQFAIDLTVAGEAISPATADAVRAVDGVSDSVLIEGGSAEVATDDIVTTASVFVVDPATIGSVLATAPQAWAAGTVLADGYLLSSDGSMTLGDRTLEGVLTEGLPDYTVFATAADAAGVELTSPQQVLMLALADDADPIAVADGVRDAVSDTAGGAGAALTVDGGAVQKAGFTQVLDTLLAVVVGLLGVAVVIALIGVANTLSLSVLERRRENALLRALGLTKRQLRGTLAVEGVLLAAVGALVGLVLGLIYGWIGGLLLLGPTTGMSIGDLTVPWTSVLAVLAVAVLAGIVASVLPARGAVRIPPVAALAAD